MAYETKRIETLQESKKERCGYGDVRYRGWEDDTRNSAVEEHVLAYFMALRSLWFCGHLPTS